MRETLLAVDGNSLMHRAFHALPLMDAGGVYTNAVHGFLSMLLKAMQELSPRYIAVAFDEHAPTFRHTAYADYKAGRRACPWRAMRRTTFWAPFPANAGKTGWIA